MTKRLATLLQFFLFTSIVFGQITELPIHLGQFFNNPQINPAEGGSVGNLEFTLGTRQNAGVFSGVKTSYASANFRFLEKDSNFHVLGLHFNNDREGLVLRRNRTFLTYSRHLRLSDKWTLASGLSIGMYDFVIKSNPVTGGANSSTEDFSAGIHLYGDSKYFSFSVNQINSATVQPLEQTLELLPLFSFRYIQNFSLSESVNLSPVSFLRFANMPKVKDRIRYGGGIKFLIKKLTDFGVTYEAKEGLYFFVGIDDFMKKFGDRGLEKDNSLKFEFSYFVPGQRNIRTTTNAFELTCQYFIFK